MDSHVIVNPFSLSYRYPSDQSIRSNVGYHLNSRGILHFLLQSGISPIKMKEEI